MVEGVGRITYSRFVEESKDLIRRSQTSQAWELREGPFYPKRQFLVLKVCHQESADEALGCFRNKEQAAHEQLNQNSPVIFDEEELEDVTSAVSSIQIGTIGNVQTYEYHVIYSESFSVPTLYFSASNPDGSLVRLNDIWKRVPEIHKHALEDKWSFISQQEHPYLGYPFYYIHPCHTPELMKNLLHGSKSCTRTPNYLMMWLSAVGPIAGLILPLSVFTGVYDD